MASSLLARIHQGFKTIDYPNSPAPPLAERFRGRPLIDEEKCPSGCQLCAKGCPTNAIKVVPTLSIDLGRCLFCTECADLCPVGAITYSQDYRLSVNRRSDLLVESKDDLILAKELGEKLKSLFGRSLKLRQVSAGGCNACEADVNVLGTIGWDLGRFGIQIVASPRHADGILVTGCVTENMREALQRTYDAVPSPKIVIAVGACAISGGPFLNNSQQHGGIADMFPVDLFVPGCPPNPLTILDGLLRLIGRLQKEDR